jgi:hypothetical protein
MNGGRDLAPNTTQSRVYKSLCASAVNADAQFDQRGVSVRTYTLLLGFFLYHLALNMWHLTKLVNGAHELKS